MAGRVIFHIDVNSAFLSWTAAYRCLVLHTGTDLRMTAGKKLSGNAGSNK